MRREDEVHRDGADFICMVGHGKPEELYPRGPRLSYETSVTTM